MIWYELCQVRYSYQMFFQLMVYTGKYPDKNNREKNVSKPHHFNVVLTCLMINLSEAAAFSPSKNMFATGKIKFSGKDTIYGLQQCTRDISASECHSCLNSARTDLLGCCSSKQGGTVVCRNCNVRFELFPFFNDTSNSLVIHPHSKGDRLKNGKAVILVSASIILLAATVFCAVHLRRKKGSEDVKDEVKNEHVLLQDLASPTGITISEEGMFIISEELAFMDLAAIKIATNDFSDLNKLGQGFATRWERSCRQKTVEEVMARLRGVQK